jgi:hypothetical protein
LIIPSAWQCDWIVADVADVSAVEVPEADDVGIVAALVITIGTPGIWNLVRSAHLLDVCAQATGINTNANQNVLIFCSPFSEQIISAWLGMQCGREQYAMPSEDEWPIRTDDYSFAEDDNLLLWQNPRESEHHSCGPVFQREISSEHLEPHATES